MKKITKFLSAALFAFAILLGTTFALAGCGNNGTSVSLSEIQAVFADENTTTEMPGIKFSVSMQGVTYEGIIKYVKDSFEAKIVLDTPEMTFEGETIPASYMEAYVKDGIGYVRQSADGDFTQITMNDFLENVPAEFEEIFNTTGIGNEIGMMLDNLAEIEKTLPLQCTKKESGDKISYELSVSEDGITSKCTLELTQTETGKQLTKFVVVSSEMGITMTMSYELTNEEIVLPSSIQAA